MFIRRERKEIQAAIHMARSDNRITNDQCAALCDLVERETYADEKVSRCNCDPMSRPIDQAYRDESWHLRTCPEHPGSSESSTSP
jgi:glutamate racemase